MAKHIFTPNDARSGELRQSDENSGFLTGEILISTPTMADPRFVQTVIYLCAHTQEGAMGIVVNRPVTRPSFKDVLEQLEIQPIPPLREIPLCAGGPVDAARGFMLHTADWTDESSLPVTDLVAVTASLGVLRVVAAGQGPRQCFLALGYAGWGPGQLDREIQSNAWLSVEPSETILFDGDYGTKWRRAMALLHVDPLLLSGTVGHA